MDGVWFCRPLTDAIASIAVEPQLRKQAKLGSWQVISPADVRGYVEIVEGLHAVQDKTYTRPTVLGERLMRISVPGRERTWHTGLGVLS